MQVPETSRNSRPRMAASFSLRHLLGRLRSLALPEARPKLFSWKLRIVLPNSRFGYRGTRDTDRLTQLRLGHGKLSPRRSPDEETPNDAA